MDKFTEEMINCIRNINPDNGEIARNTISDISGIPSGKALVTPSNESLDISGECWTWDSSYNRYNWNSDKNIWMKIGYMTRSGIDKTTQPQYTMYTLF